MGHWSRLGDKYRGDGVGCSACLSMFGLYTVEAVYISSTEGIMKSVPLHGQLVFNSICVLCFAMCTSTIRDVPEEEIPECREPAAKPSKPCYVIIEMGVTTLVGISRHVSVTQQSAPLLSSRICISSRNGNIQGKHLRCEFSEGSTC